MHGTLTNLPERSKDFWPISSRPRRIIIYRDFQLSAVEQPSGGFKMEIIPWAGGRPITLTQTFSLLEDAFASARKIVDLLSRVIPEQ